MTLDEVFQACVSMKKGEKRAFDLDEEPDVLVVMDLAYRIHLKRTDGAYVMVTNCECKISVHCYPRYPCCFRKGFV